VRGDPRWHYNVPGRPILSPALGVCFLLGLLVALRNWRRIEYIVLLLWLVGMLLPAVLTRDLMPQSQRMTGIIPGVFGLAALGIDALLTALTTRLPARVRPLPYVALVALLTFECIDTATTYFGEWASQRQVFYTYHAEYSLLARRAMEEIEAGNTVVIQSRHYKHPSVVFADLGTLEAVWAVGGKALAIPKGRPEDVLYFWPVVDNPLDKTIKKMLKQVADPIDDILDPQGRAAVHIYRLKPEALNQSEQTEALASFADEVDILDWTLPDSLRRDQTLRVLVHWRAIHPVAQARRFALHLVDENGVLWSHDEEIGYLTEQWRPGDEVYQLFEASLPPGIPAGRYQARLLFSREEGDLLPMARDGQMAGVFLALGDLVLEPDGRFIQPIAAQAATFGQTLTAISHSEVNQTAVLGGRVEFAVTWQARAEIDDDLAVAIELIDETGKIGKLYDMPLAYQYPTSQWRPGETVRAVYLLPLGSLAPGSYRLRLTVASRPGELELGSVRIEGDQRLFSVPAIQHPLVARLGVEIELLGYDLDAEEYRAGERICLRLYWRALAQATGDHKVFVHLVGDEERIWAQHDSQPANWQRPTSGWQPGEIVLDEHCLDIPPETPSGRYTLFAGMYDSTTLRRLPLEDESGHRPPDDRLPLATVIVVR